MSDTPDLKAALAPLIDLLSKPDPTDTALTPEEEAEFAARHEAEAKQEVENTRQQLLRSVTGPLERWQDGVLARLKKIEDTPPPAPVVQQVVQPAPAVMPTTSWKLTVTTRENGLARTVVASANGQDKWTITIGRTPDGFPRTIDAQAVSLH